MSTIERIKLVKVGNLYIPTIIIFIILHINHLLLTISQFSSKLYSFDFSDPTILNYLEGYANQNNIFEYRGYPTTNLHAYQPGPIPNIYIFKLSWVLNNFFDINPIYLSNILIATYPTLLIIIASTILYKNNLKLLSLTTLSITLLVQYTNNNFNASNRGPERFDTGTDHVTLIATLTLIMVILSYQKPDSSHLPLLAFSGLLLNAHFTAFALAPFTIIYAIYLISLSFRAKKYKINYRIILPIFITIYLPIIYRFLVEPLYLYDALMVKSYPVSERVLPDQWLFFFKTTPLQLFINPCEEGNNYINNMECLPYNNVKLSVTIIAIISLALLLIVMKNKNIFIKAIIILSIILINYNTFTGFEAKHSSIASGLSLAIIIYFFSKNKFLTTSCIILVISLVNFFSIQDYKYNGSNIYQKFEKTIFTPNFISEIKKAKFKIDVCNLTMDEECYREMGYKKNSLLAAYYPSNFSHVTILELIKNKIDICIIDKTGAENRIEDLICTKTENQDKDRNQLHIIRDYNFETPSTLSKFVKIATVRNNIITQCTDPIDTTFEICKNDNQIFESLFHSGAGIYLKKDAVGLNPIKLHYINNPIYEDKLTNLTIHEANLQRCTIYHKDPATGISYCFKQDSSEFITLDSEYKDRRDLYDLR